MHAISSNLCFVNNYKFYEESVLSTFKFLNLVATEVWPFLQSKPWATLVICWKLATLSTQARSPAHSAENQEGLMNVRTVLLPSVL